MRHASIKGVESQWLAIEFFTVCTNWQKWQFCIQRNLTTAKKELPPVGLDLMLKIITDLGVQCLTR